MKNVADERHERFYYVNKVSFDFFKAGLCILRI